MVREYGEKYGVENASHLTNAQANTAELRNNTTLQAGMLAEFTRENVEKVAGIGGANVSANVYALHNLGGGDGRKFLNAVKDNPTQRVDAVLPENVIRKNHGLYGDGSRSVADAYDVMAQKMDQYAAYANDAKQAIPGQIHGAQQSTGNGILKQGAHGEDVRALQENLSRLGYTDAHGRDLHADANFGPSTKAAVEAFQRDHGLTHDGIAGPKTLDVIHAQSQAPSNGIPTLAPELEGRKSTQADDPLAPAALARDPRAPGLPDAAAPAINPYANPNHPDYGLYAELRQRIPNASEERIVECTAACHKAGIEAGNVGQIHLHGTEALVFVPKGGGAGSAEVALTSPPPSIQQTTQNVQTFDQNQQVAIAQMNAQPQTPGPTIGGSGGGGMG